MNRDLPTGKDIADASSFQISLGVHGGKDVAYRFLRLAEVRSVVIHVSHRLATVHLQDEQPTAAVLEQLQAMRDTCAATARPGEATLELARWHDERTSTEAYFRAPKIATGAKRWLLLATALVTFVLAILGAILPGLPTTPFLLLTSFCLLRSSRKLHDRLLRSRTFGWLLRDWYLNRGVRPGVKTKSLVFLVLIVAATMWFSGLPPWALAVVGGCAVIGAVCILRLRVIREPVIG